MELRAEARCRAGIYTTALLACLQGGWAIAGGRDQASDLAREAVRNNPSVGALRARVRALGATVARADTWHDPVVAIEYGNIPVDSWTLGDHPMSGLQLKLQQTFIFPGKTRLRGDVARGKVREAQARLAERRVELAAAVKRGYYTLALVRQLRAINREHIKLVDRLLEAVRVKYEVGKVGQHELLQLQLLRDKLDDDLGDFDRDERALAATLNAALSRAPSAAIDTPARLSVAASPPDEGQLVQAALKRRPLLRLRSEQARTAALVERRARREKYPDLTAWAGYRVRADAGTDPGTDFVTFGLSLPLPLFTSRRWDSVAAEQRSRARAAEQQRQAAIDRIRGELGRALAAWHRAVDQARTYRDKLEPLARRTLEATLSAYRVDRADFASLYEAEAQLLRFQRTIRRAEAEAALSRVTIERLVGEEQGR